MDLLKSLKNTGAQSEVQTSALVCSRKGCNEYASYKLLWNNPKIHTVDRRKIWLACSEHQKYLEEFLQARGFWKETQQIS